MVLATTLSPALAQSAPYLGRWAEKPETCSNPTDGSNDDIPITFTRRSIETFASSCRILGIDQRGQDVRIRTRCRDEGQMETEPRTPITFTLRAERQPPDAARRHRHAGAGALPGAAEARQSCARPVSLAPSFALQSPQGRLVNRGRHWGVIMIRASFAAAFAAAVSVSAASAAEIKVISANGMREVITETKAKFEAASGHKLAITVVETGEIRRRVLAGEPYDVIMVPSNASDDFVKQNKVAAGSTVPVIRVNFGLAVRADGPKPDAATPDALKKTFLAAKKVLITDPATGGISGVHLMEVLGKLGIADEMKGKLMPSRGGGFHAARVVKGEADLAVQAEHEIKCVPGAAFIDYPKEFQRTIVFMAGIGAERAATPAPRRTTSPSSKAPRSRPSIKAHCLTPG